MKLYVCTIESYTELRTIVSVGVLAVLLLACAGMATGETWVVDYDGGADFTSVQAAVDAAGAGDTIEVRNGTYVENVNVPKRLTLIGDGADVVTVRAEVATDRVFKVSADYVNISGFTVTRGQSGIYLGGADHCNITDNNASNNDWYGISLDSSSNNTLTNNTASSNWYGIYLSSSSNNTLTNNNASGNDDGIYLSSSSNNTLTSNNASGNDYYGVSLTDSSNNELKNNAMLDNYRNFRVDGGSLSGYIQNIDTSNTVNGKPVYYWVNQQNQQIPNDAGYVGIVNSTNITVKDLTLTNNAEGVLFAYTSNSRIENVTASNNDYGISLYSSSNNTLSNNSANSNKYFEAGRGISLEALSDNNTLTNNNASENEMCGIFLSSSGNNTLTNNSANSNQDCGIHLDSSNNNTLSNSTASGNYDGIRLASSNNNMLARNNASNNARDLYIWNSESAFSNNTLSGTTISFTYEGDVSLKGVGSPAADPTGWNTIGKFISATNWSADAWIFLNFSYSGSDLSGLDEYSLKVWKHNGTTWVEDGWNKTRYLDTGGDVIGVNITTFSVFAPAALAAATHIPPDPTGLANTTGRYWVNYTWSAGTENVTDSYNVSMNETWTNGTTETFRNVSVGPGGWANITVFAYNASGTGTLSLGNISDNVQAPGEPINCTCGNICVNQTGWWRDGGVFNASETPIQAAIDGATDGDIICVWNGSYSENVNVNKRLTLQGESADVVTVRAEDGSDHVFEVTADYVNISGFTVTGAGATGWSTAGIYLDGADHCNISDNNASDNCKGIHLYSSGSNNLTNNTANSNYHGEWSSGIYLDFSNNNKLTNNTASNNGYSGIYLYSSSDNNTLTSNTASGNDDGIHLDSSSNNTLTSNTASGNVYGIKLYYSINNALTNNIASNNGDGIYLYSSNNNTLTNSNASDNTWDLYIKSSESAFRDNTLNGTTISFTYNGDVSLKGVGSPASDPDGWNTIGKFIRATNQSAGAWIFLNFSYSGSDLSGLDESSLKVWKHNGTTWIEDGWNKTRYLDTGGDVVGVNITTFSVFAPAALAAAAAGINCTRGDICVNQTGWWRDNGAFNASGTPIQAAIDSATDGDTICVWNGSYNENVDVNKQLTIRSENGYANCIVNASNSNDHVFEITAHCVNISGFTIKNATGSDKAGIYLHGMDYNISYNNITNNSEGVHIAPDASGNVINFNNIAGNSLCGINNTNVTEMVNATCNWWGDVSGPSEAGNGTGDVISTNVDYTPWLDSPYPEGEPIYFTNVTTVASTL